MLPVLDSPRPDRQDCLSGNTTNEGMSDSSLGCYSQDKTSERAKGELCLMRSTLAPASRRGLSRT